MPQKIAAFILIAFFVNSCCAPDTSSRLKENSSLYKKITQSRLGQSSKIIFNRDSTYFAAYTSEKSSGYNLKTPVKFFIYDTKEEEIIFEDNLLNGKIEWINENQVQVSTVPEIVSEKEGKEKSFYGYVYDVRLRKRIKPDLEIKEQ